MVKTKGKKSIILPKQAKLQITSSKKKLKRDSLRKVNKSKQLSKVNKTNARKNRIAKLPDEVDEFETVCSKQMPPLSELEKLYEDSNSDTELSEVDTKLQEQKGFSDIPITPTAAKKYAEEILRLLDNKAQVVIPMKKYPKPDEPYIVGCMERPRVPEKSTTIFCKGDPDYGISSKTNAFTNDDCVKSQRGYSNGYNLSKSIFNAQANEIAAKLLSENNYKNSDSDSDNTVIYELDPSINRFSPQPSTSKDSEAISRNDQKFNESLFTATNNVNIIYKHPSENEGITKEKFKLNNSVKENDISNTVETVEMPCETLVINEVGTFNIHIEKKDPNISKEINLSKCKSNAQANEIAEKLLTVPNNFDFDVIEIKENTCEIIVINENETFNANKNADFDKNKTKNINKNTNLQRKDKDYNTDTVINLVDVINKEGDIYNTSNIEVINEFPCNHNNKVSTTNRTCNINNSLVKIEDYCSPFDPNIITEIDLTNIDDVISENNSLIDKYSKYKSFSAINEVEPTPSNNHQSVTIDLLKSKRNQYNLLRTTYNQQYSGKPNNQPDVEVVENLSTEPRNNNDLIQLQDSPNVCNNIQHIKKRVSQEFDQSFKPCFGTCPICLENMSKDKIGSTNCGHLFCMPCITAALKRKPKNCPTCRKKLSGLGYHQIYI